MNKASLHIDFSLPTIAPLQSWFEALPTEVPLRCIPPKQNGAEAKSLRLLIANNPAIQGTFVEALLWLRLGTLDPAHGIVQDDVQGLGAYIHGFLHRMEGDYWNANYWFRRVRDPKLNQSILERVHPGTPTADHLTDACEQAQVDPKLLQLYVTQEWLALFQLACLMT
jgi:hypothetical protein